MTEEVRPPLFVEPEDKKYEPGSGHYSPPLGDFDKITRIKYKNMKPGFKFNSSI